MPNEAVDEKTFIELFEKVGCNETARRLGIHRRNVLDRRARIENRIGRQITPPEKNQKHATVGKRAGVDHPRWIERSVHDGVVLIGSDAHYWPGIISTAHKAFVHFAKKLLPKIIVMNGDALDGASISRFPSIGWENKPTLIEELKACQERLGEIEEVRGNAELLWPLGNHDCLDPITECLTKTGWKKHQDILSSDQVLSWDNGNVVWSPINEIVSFPYSGDLVRVEKTRVSMAVTPNHRVLLSRLDWRTKRYDTVEYRRADDLPYSFDMPVAGQINNPGVDLPDDVIALTGWLLTDGGYDKYNISLYQSKVAGIEEIEGILNRLGLKYSRYERQRKMRAICGRTLLKEPLLSVQFIILAESVGRVKQWLPAKGKLPDWAHKLNGRQFKILLDSLVAGDGCWDGFDPTRKSCAVIYGQEPILSSIQEVAVTHGWRARLATDNRGDPRLCLTKEPKIRIEKPEVFSEPYKGVVWCLRVPHGNFMVRRSGSAYFTGNSRFETRLATVAPEYANVHGMHLKDHYPLWAPCWAIKINDNVVVKHRYKGGMHAPHNNTLWSGMSIFTGHLHQLKVSPISDYNGRRYGVDTGTMADVYGPQFSNYTEQNPLSWASGFVVATFKNGELLPPELVTVLREGVVTFRGEVIAV